MNANDIVTAMFEKDYFSQWLGIQVIEINEASCKLKMTITRDMLNGFGIAHGGITYSFADSALAFASNNTGRKCVSIETSISHLVSLKENDEIVAEAKREAETEKLAHYQVKIYKLTEPLKAVALFKGIVYKTSATWSA